MMRDKIIMMVCLLLLTLGCNSKKDNDLFEQCGTEESPYYLYETVRNSDTLNLNIRFISILPEDSSFTRDTFQFLAALERLREDFSDALIDYTLLEIKELRSDVLYNNMGDYVMHWRSIEQELFKSRSEGALNVLVYPPSSNIFPGAAVAINANAFAIQSNRLTSSTITHEASHCFGLYHTHQKGDGTDGRNYIDGDFICQIPFHPPLTGNIDPTSRTIISPKVFLTEDEQKVLIENYMSYTVFALRDSWLSDQIARMRKTILTTEHHKVALVY